MALLRFAQIFADISAGAGILSQTESTCFSNSGE